MNPFIQVAFEDRIYIPFIKVFSPNNISNFYVFTSSIPIDIETSLSQLLARDYVTSNQVFHYNSGDTVFIHHTAKYIRVQFPTTTQLVISELVIPGDDVTEEICDNELDDNCDGRIDCEDIQCGIHILNAYGVNTSCPICNDGEIHIQASGQNKEFSIDGGVTFSAMCFDEFEQMCFWKGLEQGDYTVVVRNSVAGCESEYPETIEVRSVPPGMDGPCENGGFEHGNFDGWVGGTGTNDDENHIPNINMPGLSLNDHHAIINIVNLPDPFVPSINGNYPGLGQFVARLGADNSDLDAEELVYCFTVTQENSDFNFVYALVMEHPHGDDPHHYEPQRAQFSWHITATNPYDDIDGDLIYSSEDPPFMRTFDHADLLVYKGWTCESVDLSGHIGDEVCIRFLTADCTETDHYSYAYIDGLCSSQLDLTPSISIHPNKTLYCEGDPVILNVIGSGYEEYTWTIFQRDQNDAVFGSIVIGPTHGFDASIDDLVLYYEDNSEYTLDCNSKVVASLTVNNNNCGGEATTKTEIIFECLGSIIDYCDTIYICDGNIDQRILGVNECNGCTITWKPEQFLILDDPHFPLVVGSLYFGAYNQTYVANIVGPNGCINSSQSVRFYNASNIDIEHDETITHCSADYEVKVDLKANLPTSFVKVYLYDIISQTEIEMQVDPSSTQRNRSYSLSIDRDEDKDIYILVRFDFEPDEDCSQETCESLVHIGELPKSNYTGNWVVEFPNVFVPQSSNPDINKWYPTFFSEDLNCENPSDEYNNIWGMKIVIWDRWGTMVFEKEVIKGVFDEIGVLESEMTWDGKAKDGEWTHLGLHACQVWFYSCYGIAGLSNCFEPHCPCTELEECGEAVCSSMQENFYAFGITVL